MKMVKSLLLVSAAGLVAVSGAQAADLPVKAKPVEYVKVCSLYGAGFYYIPGTDICMKIGGYVRFQVGTGPTTSIGNNIFSTGGSFANREASADYTYRTRAIATFDTRQQTAYGTLRTYLLIGYTQENVSNTSAAVTPLVDGLGQSVYNTRAFIQIAGFTFGKATSFFDFFANAAINYTAGLYTPDTGDAGAIVASYTAQFGNGVSGTIGVEQARRRAVDYYGAAIAGGGAGPVLAADIQGTSFLLDWVGNVRIDQAWGSAQISAAVHDVSPSYYNSGPGGTGLLEANGHPDRKYGWAVSGGLRLNAPMFGPGDYFVAAGVYSVGAIRYASLTPTTYVISHGSEVAFIRHEDGGFTGTAAAPGSFELTTAWSFGAAYEHFWTPALRTSLYGSYVNISRSDTLNNALCASGLASTAIAAASFAASRAAGCDLNASAWNIGSRSQWNVTKDFYVGLDVIYNKVETARLNAAGTAILAPAVALGKTAGNYTTADLDQLQFTWRVHRDIVP